MNKYLIPQMLLGVCFIYLVVQSSLHSPSDSIRNNVADVNTHFQGSSRIHLGVGTVTTQSDQQPVKEEPKQDPQEQPKQDPQEQSKQDPQEQPKQDPQEQSKQDPQEQPKDDSNNQGEDYKNSSTICKERNQRPVLLCSLGLQKHCKRIQISEQLSSWWMVCPIYSANVEQTGILYDLHKNFRDYAQSYGIQFQTVETVFPGQEFLLTKPNNQPHDLQYHADWIFAMRENLVNVGVKHLPDDWQYVSWIDQHIFWTDPYWFEKSIWLFEHYNIVHLLNGNDFWDRNNKTDYSLTGFAYLYAQYGMDFQYHDPRQCGLAWGTRREIFEPLGGLFDLCIGTKCDLYQNYAYAGAIYTAQTNNPTYASKIRDWQNNAIKVYDRKLGYLDSKVIHFMHCVDGCKTSDYNLQINALNRWGYNPDHDLRRDEEGRLILENNLELQKELWTLYGGSPRS